MNKKLKVIHIEFVNPPDESGKRHFYFGSKIALCAHFGKDKIGCTYLTLRTHNLKNGPYKNKKCIIRQDILRTFGDIVKDNRYERS